MKGSSVLVLVAFDVDALAGARLLKVRIEIPSPISLILSKFQFSQHKTPLLTSNDNALAVCSTSHL